MVDGLVATAAQGERPDDRRIYGVVVAIVVNNLDVSLLGRVQIRLPWLPGLEPWARVASLSAGLDRGAYFMPRVNDEVLVCFNHGDVRDPFVIGCLWNGQDRPPIALPTDAVTKKIIRTPLGHEVVFDEGVGQSITIKSMSGQRVVMEPKQIEIGTALGTATAILGQGGTVAIEAKVGIDLRAPRITINGSVVTVEGSASTTVKGGAACTIEAALVKIN